MKLSWSQQVSSQQEPPVKKREGENGVSEGEEQSEEKGTQREKKRREAKAWRVFVSRDWNLTGEKSREWGQREREKKKIAKGVKWLRVQEWESEWVSEWEREEKSRQKFKSIQGQKHKERLLENVSPGRRRGEERRERSSDSGIHCKNGQVSTEKWPLPARGGRKVFKSSEAWESFSSLSLSFFSASSTDRRERQEEEPLVSVCFLSLAMASLLFSLSLSLSLLCIPSRGKVH